MTFRETIKQVVHREEGAFGSSAGLPENLRAAIAWLQEKLDSLPLEMRDGATLEIEGGDAWGSPVVEVTIEGRRPETDEEMADRLRMEAARQANALLIKEANERAAYEALKRKYGDQP